MNIDRKHDWRYGGRIVRYYCLHCHTTHEYGQMNGYQLEQARPNGPCMSELDIKQLVPEVMT